MADNFLQDIAVLTLFAIYSLMSYYWIKVYYDT